MTTGEVLPRDAVRVDLSPYRNNAAFLAAGAPPADGFDGFGRAYPSESLQDMADLLKLPTDLGHGSPDNVSCEGQLLDLDAPVLVCGLEVVGAGSGGAVSEAVRLLPPGDSAPPETEAIVELGDFLSRRPLFGNRCFAEGAFLYDVGGRPEHGARPRLWRTTIHFETSVSCARIELPVNPDLHILGVWLLPAADGRATKSEADA